MLSFNIVHSLVHIITSLHSKFHFIIYRNKKKILVCLACSIVSAITVCFQDYMLISQDNEEKIGHFFMTKITITPSFINPYKKCWCHFVPFGKLYPMQLELEHSKHILFFCLIPNSDSFKFHLFSLSKLSKPFLKMKPYL